MVDGLEFVCHSIPTHEIKVSILINAFREGPFWSIIFEKCLVFSLTLFKKLTKSETLIFIWSNINLNNLQLKWNMHI